MKYPTSNIAVSQEAWRDGKGGIQDIDNVLQTHSPSSLWMLFVKPPDNALIKYKNKERNNEEIR